MTAGGNVVVSGQLIPAWTISPFFQSYLAGLQLSNDVSLPNTVLDITAGVCSDSTNVVYIQLGSFTKSTGGAWVAGTGQNGMGNGLTIANTTWYHVFAIVNSGVADIYFDTSASAANAPTGTTAVRRIGAVKTDASAHILAFTQFGDEFLWKNPPIDVNALTPAATQTLYTLNTPLGVQVRAFGYALVVYTGTNDSVSLYPPDMGTQAANAWFTNASSIVVSSAATKNTVYQFIRTNLSSQIAALCNNASAELIWTTFGWEDRRGRDI
jgi:hypothetical protein